MSKDIKRVSKRLSWLLRHGASDAKLAMDAAGWVSLNDVSLFLRVSKTTLAQVVESNNKRRYEVREGYIRASQGHSPGGVPVELEALEKSWVKWPGEHVWHGTSVPSVDEIYSESLISPMSRTHVHLAESLVSRVGKRANVAIGLRVNAALVREAGFEVYRSSNGVILCRQVPWSAVDGFVPLTKKARAEAAVLAARWGLSRLRGE